MTYRRLPKTCEKLEVFEGYWDMGRYIVLQHVHQVMAKNLHVTGHILARH